MAASGEQTVTAAFAQQHSPLAGSDDNTHPFTHRIKRNLTHTTVFFRQLPPGQSGFRCRTTKSCFGRVTGITSILPHNNITAQRKYDQCHFSDRILQRVIRFTAMGKSSVSFTDFPVFPSKPQCTDRHTIGGQRAGFIGTDYIGTSKRLNCREFAQQRIPGNHSPYRQCQRNRDNCRQAFRYCRNRQTDTGHQHIPQVLSPKDTSNRYQRTDNQAADRDIFSQLVQFLLQRRLFIGNLCQHSGDSSHLG